MSRNNKLLKLLKEERHTSQKVKGQSVKEKQTIKGSSELLNRLDRNRNRSSGRDSLKKTERYIVNICLYHSTVKGGFGGNPEWELGIKLGERNHPKFTEIPALPAKRMIQTFSTDTPLLAPTPLAGWGWGVGFRPLLRNAEIRYHALRKNLAALCRQYGMAEMARKKSHTSKASFFEAVNLTRNKPHPPNSPTRYGEAEKSLPSARQSREAQVCAAQSGACVGGFG